MLCTVVSFGFALVAAQSSSVASAHTLAVRVTDPSGAPISDAHVWLAVSRVCSVDTTDAEGRAHFDGVRTGPVQLVAYKHGHAIGGATGQCISDTDLTVTLQPPAGTRIRVINTRYEPIEGARLRRLELPGVFAVFTEDLADLGFPAAPSSADGFLELPPLPEGSFASVTIGHAAYADGTMTALPTGVDLDFPLPDGVPLVGRISSEAGDGLERARVSIYRQERLDPPVLITEVLTGPEGFYSAMVPPGKYFVAALHPQCAMRTPMAVMADGLGGNAVLDLVLPAGRRLFGHALDEAGAPVPLAIFAYRTENYVVAEAVSDATGLFEMIVPAGQGALHVRPPRRMTTVEFPRHYLFIRDEPQIEIESIRFRAAPEIRGRVTAREDAPLDKVLITSLNLEPPVAAITDAAGHFSIELETVPDEPLRFRAEHALRFLRDDFKIDPFKLEAPVVRLREYRPEPHPPDSYWPNNLKPLVGRPAPELECGEWLNLPDGVDPPRLDALHGKTVVLMLWAGFDRSARNLRQIAEMNAIHALLKDVEDVAILSVHDSAAPPETIANYVREFGIEYPVGVDVESSETFTRYRTGYVPQIMLIDRSGLLRHYITDGKVLELIKLLRRG